MKYKLNVPLAIAYCQVALSVAAIITAVGKLIVAVRDVQAGGREPDDSRYLDVEGLPEDRVVDAYRETHAKRQLRRTRVRSRKT